MKVYGQRGMKVLLCYHFQGNFAMAGMEPLGLIELGRLLRDRGHEVRYAKMDLGLVRKAIKAFQPRLIGYSICSVHHNHAIDLNRKLKQEYDFYSMFGGPHPTFFPEMIEEGGVDAICVGEADLSFPDFVDRLEAGDNFQENSQYVGQAGAGADPAEPPCAHGERFGQIAIF